MPPTRWIVVGTDFSYAAATALDHAIELAAERGANVACVHAYEDPFGMTAMEDPAPGLRAQIEEAIAMSAAGNKRVHVEPFVRRGPPWDKLANVATDLGADLLVVGARGQREAPHHFYLGTVAARLAASSTRAVLVIPSTWTGQRRPL